ncbi:hypothetical protein GCM10027592_29660 [Spirosoma flavus]
MNTEQSYVGRGNSANTPPQTANSGLQTPFNREDWQSKLLLDIYQDDEARDDLFTLLYQVWDFNDSDTPFELIGELFSFWISRSQNDLNEKQFEVRNLFSLITFLITLKNRFVCFDNNSGYTNKYKLKQKEVSHE